MQQPVVGIDGFGIILRQAMAFRFLEAGLFGEQQGIACVVGKRGVNRPGFGIFAGREMFFGRRHLRFGFGIVIRLGPQRARRVVHPIPEIFGGLATGQWTSTANKPANETTRPADMFAP